MKVEKQVTSLELSRKLKELGCTQKSLFYWVPGSLEDNGDGNVSITVNDNEKMAWSILNAPEEIEGELYFPFNLTYIDYDSLDWEVEHKRKRDELKNKVCSAYTVAELGEMLPQYIAEGFLVIRKDDEWNFSYEKRSNGEIELIFHCYDKKEADARAKMMIFLIEKGLGKWNELLSLLK
jgi:hypothetical protein